MDLAVYTQDGLSEFDLAHLTEIIREDFGDWYHAKLLRALAVLLPHADATNTRRLEEAYPGSVAAFRVWYNDLQAFASLRDPA
jgi:hypothetical protein